MPDPTQLALYFAAALLLAVTPGPGIFYVAARTLAGGRARGHRLQPRHRARRHGPRARGEPGRLRPRAGERGAVHRAEAGRGRLSGLDRVPHHPGRAPGCVAALAGSAAAPPIGPRRAFREGVLVEALNPKTAAFFLAFVPQFVDPAVGSVAPAVPGARLRVGRAQHAGGRRGRLRGGRHPGRRRGASRPDPPPPGGLGSRDDRPGRRLGTGETPYGLIALRWLGQGLQTTHLGHSGTIQRQARRAAAR